MFPKNDKSMLIQEGRDPSGGNDKKGKTEKD